MHGKAVEREQRLKSELQAARAKLKELRQRLRERWARRRGSEKRTRSAGTEAAAAARSATQDSVGFRVQWILQVLQRGRSASATAYGVASCIGSVIPALRAGPH